MAEPLDPTGVQVWSRRKNDISYMKVAFKYISPVTEEKATVTRTVLGTPDRGSLVNLGRAYERIIGPGFKFHSFKVVENDAVVNQSVKRVWCRVRNDGDPFLQWIPGYRFPDGTVQTAMGVMENPDDEEEDCKEFSDCPFIGYSITEV